jgi:hypothetical protein
MPDNTATLNEDGLGQSSSPDAPNVDLDSTNIIGTLPESLDDGPISGRSSEETLKTDDGEKDEVNAGEGTGKEGEEKPQPYHKDPAWQRIMKEREEAKEETARVKAEVQSVKAEMESLKATRVQPQREEKLPYVDITTMEVDKLQEWQMEDPKGYAANLYAQMRYEFRKEEEQRSGMQRVQSSIAGTFEDYKTKNPDFDPMWKSGELKKFMDDHPGHNAISAHQLLTMDKRIQEASEKASKETEAKVLANQKAKRSAQVLGGAPAVVGGDQGIDEAFKDTKSHGGKAAVLAKKILELRKGRGG